MAKPKRKRVNISAVCPTYNSSSYISRTLASLVEQVDAPDEVIFCDDGSNDDTTLILEQWKPLFLERGIDVFINKNDHQGPGAARNCGVKHARYSWIAFLDSDDIWWQDRLKVLFDFIKKHNNYDVICTNELWINKMNNKKNNKTIASKYGPYKNNFYEILLKYGNCLSTSASVVKKKYLIDNKIFFSEEKDFTPYEDYDFWMRIAKNNGKFKFLNEVLGEHLFHKESWGEKNRSILKKSTLSILKHHVFNVQNFTNRKKNLWSHIECGLILNDITGLLFSKKYFKGFVELFKLFCRYPIKLITHILFRL